MNCRIAPIDARFISVMRPLVSFRQLTRMALQHCPEEGDGGST